MSAKKRTRVAFGLAAVGALTIGLAACSTGDSGDGGGSSDELTTVGFVAVGPEGAWREANEQNIQDTFTEEAGYDLKYAPPPTSTRSPRSTHSRRSSTRGSMSSCSPPPRPPGGRTPSSARRRRRSP